jgi:hypothetical protein
MTTHFECPFLVYSVEKLVNMLAFVQSDDKADRENAAA